MTLTLNHTIITHAIQPYSLLDAPQESTVHKTLKTYCHENQHLATSEHAYNHLVGGRVGLLVALAIIYEETFSQDIHKMMVSTYHKIMEDARFLQDKLTWLPPHPKNTPNNESIFTRNIGIYLGLSVIQHYFIDENCLPIITKNINFEIELQEIVSIKYRKLVKKMLEMDAKSLILSDIYTLITYAESTQNSTVSEAIVCFATIGGFLENTRIHAFINQTFVVKNELLTTLFELLILRQTPQKYTLIFSESPITDIMSDKLSSLYQYCGDEFMNNIITSQCLHTTLNPTIWLKTIAKLYPERSLLFKNIIWREKLIFNPPAHIFSISAEAQNATLLHQCYTDDLAHFLNRKFRIDIAKADLMFSSFWLGMLPIKNFKELNVERKIIDFRRTQQYARCTILLTKRFEKVVIWQGRSFRDNDEIDLIFYFLNDYNSPNDYLQTFGAKALSQQKVMEILFWCLEIGLLKS
jgi:hypothetical protein